MKFEVTLWEALRYFSFAINVVLFVLWLRGRVVLNSFLVGRWEGVFEPSDGKDDIIKCTLYVACHKDTDNSAHLFYCKEHLDHNETRAKGVDSLVGYDSNVFFVVNRTWKPKFIRVMHKNGVYASDECREHPSSYFWECTIISIFFRPKMKVKVRVRDSDLTFAGTLSKI
jgi:hypothetical protein